MSDADLRELERRFREIGSVEDEAAWLRARVQAGELGEELLELASDLGHPASRLATNGSIEFQRPERSVFLEWARDLPAEQGLRVALAMIRSLLSSPDCDQEEEWTKGLTQEASEALTHVEAWIACPCPSHLARTQECDSLPRGIPAGWVEHACLHAAPAMWNVVEFLRSGEEAKLQRAIGWPCMEGTRTAVQAELVPWALGYGDPVRERVEARHQEVAGE